MNAARGSLSERAMLIRPGKDDDEGTKGGCLVLSLYVSVSPSPFLSLSISLAGMSVNRKTDR